MHFKRARISTLYLMLFLHWVQLQGKLLQTKCCGEFVSRMPPNQHEIEVKTKVKGKSVIEQPLKKTKARLNAAYVKRGDSKNLWSWNPDSQAQANENWVENTFYWYQSSVLCHRQLTPWMTWNTVQLVIGSFSSCDSSPGISAQKKILSFERLFISYTNNYPEWSRGSL